MNTRTVVRSLAAARIGQPVYAALAQRSFSSAAVLSVHRQVINLMTPDGDLAALVAPRLGAGPFNMVLDGWPPGLLDLTPGMRADCSPSTLHIGAWRIDLTAASRWQPQPDWALLAQAPALAAGIAALQRWLLTGPAWPLTRQLDRLTAHALQTRVEAVLQAPVNSIQAGALAALIGLGPGLTPVGDDWLAGWLLRWRLDAALLAGAPTAPPLRLADLTRTTQLSQAFLRAAWAGWVDEPWQALLAALARNEASAMQRQAQQIMQHGATSGCAMLSGFLRSL